MNRVSCVVFAVVMLISALSHAQKVDVGGLVQARYTDQQCEDADFTVKAARVKLSMKVTDQITVVSQFDVAKEPNLLDAMIDYELSRLVTFRVGQFSLPFGFETQVSRYYLEAMDRSLVISHLWNNGVSSPYIRDDHGPVQDTGV
jgi:phosphate-selective porin